MSHATTKGASSGNERSKMSSNGGGSRGNKDAVRHGGNFGYAYNGNCRANGGGQGS
ncbi:MAG: hypothetical protein ACR2OV_06725 [Hyphomicrobiaceae bacterium]